MPSGRTMSPWISSRRWWKALRSSFTRSPEPASYVLLGALVVLLFANLATGGESTTALITRAGEQSGFAGLFIASGVLAILGGVAMIPIKSVK